MAISEGFYCTRLRRKWKFAVDLILCHMSCPTHAGRPPYPRPTSLLLLGFCVIACLQKLLTAVDVNLNPFHFRTAKELHPVEISPPPPYGTGDLRGDFLSNRRMRHLERYPDHSPTFYELDPGGMTSSGTRSIFNGVLWSPQSGRVQSQLLRATLESHSQRLETLTSPGPRRRWI